MWSTWFSAFSFTLDNGDHNLDVHSDVAFFLHIHKGRLLVRPWKQRTHRRFESTLNNGKVGINDTLVYVCGTRVTTWEQLQLQYYSITTVNIHPFLLSYLAQNTRNGARQALIIQLLTFCNYSVVSNSAVSCR